jgi:hypothetical protein
MATSRWVQSFLADRQLQLVIDGHTCPAQSIQSGVPQGSPVSPILFAIYLSGIFEAVEAAVPGVRALSFADDIELVATADTRRERETPTISQPSDAHNR